MHRLSAFVIFIAVTVAACGSGISYKKLLSENRANISRLQLGMTKQQVTEIMKEYNVKIHGEYYPSPLKVDTYKRNGDTYEVLYYLTKRHIVFMPIMDGQATQVVLKNGKVTEVKQNPGI